MQTPDAGAKREGGGKRCAPANESKPRMQEQDGREEASVVRLQMDANTGCRSKAEGRKQALCTCKCILTLDAGAGRKGGGERCVPANGCKHRMQEQGGSEEASIVLLQVYLDA